MTASKDKHNILILGASGFIGHTIYKELCSYFNTYGTYNSPNNSFEKNAHFIEYNHQEDDIYDILDWVKPKIIISCLRGEFHTQIIAHQHLATYIKENSSKLIYLSSANVFDAYSKYPSYELDKTLSNSIYGHFKIKIENILMRLPKTRVAILRLPMVFGHTSHRILEIKEAIKEKQPIEVFPNLILNVTTDNKIAQQVHYIINRKKYGVFHLGSTDLVHHNEFIHQIVNIYSEGHIKYKQVYTTNDDRYLAVLPKYNLLPKHLQNTSSEVLKELGNQAS
ncbi:MAG: dTDP-4-dehydrorhamnose reductase [Bacteroidetes bacterium MedPE-SWsnd-G2]|nr:MAG: dTDP-4-dehydrorhamnose reductase [Bacteroidetes bacterium MedPE-SWsnd-G2]